MGRCLVFSLRMRFKEKTGLQIDLVEVWGQTDFILAFFNNRDIPRITEDMWGEICDLLDDMGYPEEYKIKWYLDRRFYVRTYISSSYSHVF